MTIFFVSVLFVIWFSIVGLIQSAFGVFLEFPAVLFVTIWATILVFGLSQVVQLAERTRLPIFTIVVLWVGLWSCTDLNDNHEIQHIQSGPRNIATSVDGAFRTWLDAREKDPDVQRPYPVFLVAAEGGGARAAYFTALVLEELRARCPRFLRHTFLITGVSGGSLGAALVTASAAAEADSRAEGAASTPLACGHERGEQAGVDSEVVRALSWDFLSPLVRGALIHDLLARLIPTDLAPDVVRRGFMYATDRARYHERALERAWQAQTGRGLGEFTFQRTWRGPQGEVPALMLLTTNVETGQRMAVSHLAMPRSPLTQDACPEEPTATTASDEEARMRTLSELTCGLDLPLATAAVLSARFPIVTPAGTLPGAGPRHRYVDGGYFENSGLTTVLEVVDVLRKVVREEEEVRLVILRIENGRATTNLMTAAGAPKRDPASHFAELASPIRALLATRQARGDQARATVARVVRDAEAACASRAPGSATVCVRMEEIVFALEPSCVPIPLGWSLTQSARQEIQRQLLGGTPSKPCRGESSMGILSNAKSLKRVLKLEGADEEAAPATSP